MRTRETLLRVLKRGVSMSSLSMTAWGCILPTVMDIKGVVMVDWPLELEFAITILPVVGVTTVKII